ncbi:hypothetical protein [Streptomyces sp. NPDC047000]|uniref:hypothetical protein n=1 Tax=Streptomyces sp. NPDC047000 TaxID=3155474 RepID=UPI003404064B
MGAFSRIWPGRRGRRAAAVAGLAVIAVGGVAACQPGGVSSATVAYTTDRTATAELTRRHVNVRWLTCTADYGDRSSRTTSPSAAAQTIASVDCRGQTADNRAVTVTGKVTGGVDGACVRGDLTAEVGGRQWFHVNGLGNCDATTGPAYTPPVTYAPTRGGRQPGPTVTVTRTIWCKGDPTCWPVQGK